MKNLKNALAFYGINTVYAIKLWFRWLTHLSCGNETTGLPSYVCEVTACSYEYLNFFTNCYCRYLSFLKSVLWLVFVIKWSRNIFALLMFVFMLFSWRFVVCGSSSRSLSFRLVCRIQKFTQGVQLQNSVNKLIFQFTLSSASPSWFPNSISLRYLRGRFVVRHVGFPGEGIGNYFDQFQWILHKLSK